MPTNFENLANNPLDGVLVSINRRLRYTDINIERMTKNNPGGIYDILVEHTKNCRNAYALNQKEEESGESIRIAYTAELQKSVEEFKDNMRKIEKYLSYKHGNTSLIYLELFAHGLSQYTKALLSEIAKLISKAHDFTLKYGTELSGENFEVLFKGNMLRFETAYKQQQQAQGDVTNRKSLKEMLWYNLKKQLYINMLTIIINNPDNPKLMISYFEDKIMRFRKHKDDGSTADTYKLSIAAASSKVADISFSVDDTILIINNGYVPIFYYAAATADAAQPAQLSEIAVGDEAEVKATQLGAPANKFLILVNKDANLEAEAEIALI